MTTFLQTPAALVIGCVIVVLGIAACLALMLCVVAREADSRCNEKEN